MVELVHITRTVAEGLIDPKQMEDDEYHIDVGNGGQQVLDISADPRGPGKHDDIPEPPAPVPARSRQQERPQQAPGPQALPVEGALQPYNPVGQVQQLRSKPKPSAEEVALSEFVASMGVDPTTVGLEAIPEVSIPAPTKAAVQQARVAPATAAEGDVLERAKQAALAVFNALPVGVEIHVPVENEFVMGMGVLIGEGRVVYRGNGHYGRKA